MLSLDVPTAVMRGESIWLNCTLDLESDDLYSVKWYKNDVEFYRYLPRDNPAGQKYDLPGVYLDLERSVQGNVFLRETDLNTEGLYRCEASAESPTFQTVEGEKMIKVYVLPDEDPKILGSQPRYEVGDVVNVTCRSGPSKPAAALKWYINGKEADMGMERIHAVEDHLDGLSTSSLGLVFRVRPTDLHQGGAVTLRCTATVSQTYSTTSEELIVGDRDPELASPPNPFTVIARDGPVISGGKAHYRVGDLLDVNCSSAKSHPMPELQWFLNDKQVEKEHVIRYRNQPGLLGLRLRVQPRHLDENEEMRLKCTATLSKVINTRSEETTLGGNHRTSGLTVAENFGKVSERSSSSSSTQNGVRRIAPWSLLAILGWSSLMLL
ncbi:putative beat protein [Trichonephila inaurata madagascariensis]|uniref:Putative beat protein n=2 Tax=Trichonephila inaurata madagascariensis TaxID=2747483 RepID=A0A8X6XX36_9ARAC|nr:putative beat protein [Trichonephila inaurata madagascariensis]